MIYLRLALYEKLLRLIDGSWVFIILLHPLLCMFAILYRNTFKKLFSVKAESSPATQFESINSSVLSLLYGPTHIHI